MNQAEETNVMSKKDKSQVIEGQEVVDETVAATEAEKLEKFKQQKKEAAKRFKERRAAEKENTIKTAQKFIESCKADGKWDAMADEYKQWLCNLANPVAAAGNEPVFNKLFGANPEIGTKVTMREVFEKTLKGKSNIDNLVKKWAERGIVVSYQPNPEDITQSTYTVESLGA